MLWTKKPLINETEKAADKVIPLADESEIFPRESAFSRGTTLQMVYDLICKVIDTQKDQTADIENIQQQVTDDLEPIGEKLELIDKSFQESIKASIDLKVELNQLYGLIDRLQAELSHKNKFIETLLMQTMQSNITNIGRVAELQQSNKVLEKECEIKAEALNSPIHKTMGLKERLEANKQLNAKRLP